MNVRHDPTTAAFGAALRREAGLSIAARPAAPKIAVPVALPLSPDSIALGTAETGGAIGLDLGRLLDGRLLVQGASGAGKSWTLRRLLEQTAGRIQQVIVDPEGEFRSFAEASSLVILDHRLDRAALVTAAERVREHRVSVLLDLSDVDRQGQMTAVEFWSPKFAFVDLLAGEVEPCP